MELILRDYRHSSDDSQSSNVPDVVTGRHGVDGEQVDTKLSKLLDLTL